MLTRDPSYAPSILASPSLERGPERRRGAAALLAAVSSVHDPRAARERLEEELRAVLQARGVIVREEPASAPAPPDAICVDVPTAPGETRARIEVFFETNRALDEWTCQVIESGAQLAAIVLELERASGRLLASVKRQADGAAPLIGSSDAIRRVRERIERVAATDFTVLIEGAIGPEPHPSFVDVFGEATLGRGQGALAGAGEDAAWASLTRLT
jgi:proline-rich tail region repeat protein